MRTREEWFYRIDRNTINTISEREALESTAVSWYEFSEQRIQRNSAIIAIGHLKLDFVVADGTVLPATRGVLQKMRNSGRLGCATGKYSGAGPVTQMPKVARQYVEPSMSLTSLFAWTKRIVLGNDWIY